MGQKYQEAQLDAAGCQEIQGCAQLSYTPIWACLVFRNASREALFASKPLLLLSSPLLCFYSLGFENIQNQTCLFHFIV